MDEIYSFIVANNDRFPLETIIEELKSQKNIVCVHEILSDYWLKVFSYDEFRDICSVSSSDKSSLLTIYLNKSICDEHPPLYYFVLHFICSLTHSSNLFLIGYTINIISMLLACVFVYKIVKSIKGESSIAILAVSYFGLSYGFLCFITFCRMYALNAMLLTYIALLYLKLNKGCPNGCSLLVVCCVEVLAMLTSYFSFLFIFPLFVYSAYNLRNQKLQLHKFISYHILACGVYLLLWPQVIFYLFNGISVRSELDFDVLERVYYYSKFAFLALLSNKYIVLVVGLLFLVSVLYKIIKVKSDDEHYKSPGTNVIILVPALFYFFCVMIISPWMHHRYMYPIYPVISIIFFLLLHDSLKVIFESAINRVIVLGLFITVLSVFFVPKVQIEYLYTKTEKKDSFCSQYHHCPALILTNSFNLKPLQTMVNYQHKSYQILNTSISNASVINQLDQSVLYVDRADSINLYNYVLDNSCEISLLNLGDELYDIYYIKKLRR